MKKTNKSAVLVFVLLVLVAVTAMYVASTYAKYTAEVTGTGSVTVAKWAFDTDNPNANFTVALDKTYDPTTLVANKIAPGTAGSFKVKLVNTNSEVGVNFTLSLGSIDGKPTNLKFYKDSSYSTEIVPGTTNVTGQIKAGDSTGIEVPIYWKWVYETGGAVTNGVTAGDAADTLDGKAATSLSLPISVKGVQTEPSTTAIETHID